MPVGGRGIGPGPNLGRYPAATARPCPVLGRSAPWGAVQYYALHGGGKKRGKSCKARPAGGHSGIYSGFGLAALWGPTRGFLSVCGLHPLRSGGSALVWQLHGARQKALARAFDTAATVRGCRNAPSRSAANARGLCRGCGRAPSRAGAPAHCSCCCCACDLGGGRSSARWPQPAGGGARFLDATAPACRRTHHASAWLRVCGERQEAGGGGQRRRRRTR
jgi:hypothetical protein